MWHLIKSELLRFRRLGFGFAVAHLLVLRAVSGFGDFFAPSAAKIGLGLLTYALTGLILGLYQIGSHKKIHRWAYLIHRPLAPRKIFLALCTAAGMWLFLVLSLPQLLITLYLDGMTPLWVDLRQYALIPFLFGTAFSFYLVGCFITLSRSRGALLVAFLPYFFLTRDAVGLWVFLPQLVVLAWLAYLAASAFKPDLSTPLRRPLAVAASAFPTQYALFWVLVAASAVGYQSLVIFQEEGWTGYATHAWDTHFAEGSYMNAQYQHGIEALDHGLRGEDTQRSVYLRKQIELAEILETSPWLAKFPSRGQLMFADGSRSLIDEDKDIVWTFSHDRMLFHGRDQGSGKAIGWLGLDGRIASRPFPEVPYVVGNRFLLTQQRIYRFDPRREQVDLRFEVGPGEQLYGGFEQEASMLTALTDKAFYFFDPKDLRDESGPMAPTAAFALPGEIRNLSGVEVAELLDGYLVSFLFGTRSEAGYGPARQIMAELRVDGSHEVVAERVLGQGWPAFNRYRGFIFSPFLEWVHGTAWSWIGPDRANRVGFGEIASRELPASVLLGALSVAGLSALLTAFVGRSRDLTPKARGAWVLAAFCLGLPAFLSLFLVTGKREGVELPASRPRLLRQGWRMA